MASTLRQRKSTPAPAVADATEYSPVERTTCFKCTFSTHLGVTLSDAYDIGVKVDAADPADLIAKAGIEVGAVITAINGTPVTAPDKAIDLMNCEGEHCVTYIGADDAVQALAAAAKRSTSSSGILGSVFSWKAVLWLAVLLNILCFKYGENPFTSSASTEAPAGEVSYRGPDTQQQGPYYSPSPAAPAPPAKPKKPKKRKPITDPAALEKEKQKLRKEILRFQKDTDKYPEDGGKKTTLIKMMRERFLDGDEDPRSGLDIFEQIASDVATMKGGKPIFKHAFTGETVDQSQVPI